MADSIKPFDDGKGNGFTHPDKALEDLLGYKPGKEVRRETIVLASRDFSIEEKSDRYRLKNVDYNGERCVIDWGKGLLDKGRRHRQTKWLEMTKDSAWKLPSEALYYAVFAALYRNRKHPDAKQKKLVEKVRQMFRNDFEEYSMITSTVVFYPEYGNDLVVHDKGYSSNRVTAADIVGPQGFISAKEDFVWAVETLLETKDISEAKKVHKWMFGKRTFLYRREEKPKNIVRAGLLLSSTDKHNFGISVQGTDIELIWPAHGAAVYNIMNKDQD